MPSIPDFKPILIEKGNKDKIEQNIELPVDVEAPVEKGQIIGKVIFKLNDEKIGEYSLVSEEEIPRLTFTEAFLRILRAFKSKNS
jgi:D-alanyl-D-alanine carboxypeptidase (penicillin-binding protein 5/6)